MRRQSDYQRYLASREWAVLKRKVRERSGGHCERCIVRRYEETHHLTYERVGRERLEDLLAVCSLCHRFLSGISDCDPRALVFFRASVAFGSVAREFLKLSKSDPDGTMRWISWILHRGIAGHSCEICQRTVEKIEDVQTGVTVIPRRREIRALTAEEANQRLVELRGQAARLQPKGAA